MILTIIVIASIILVIIAINDISDLQRNQAAGIQDSEKALTVAEPTLEETLWDDLVELTEQLTLISDSLNEYDVPYNAFPDRREIVTVEDIKKKRKTLDEFVSFHDNIQAKLEKYWPLIDPDKIYLKLKPGVFIKPTMKKVSGRLTPDFQTLADLYKDRYVFSSYLWGKIKNYTRGQEFHMLSKNYFQSSSQRMLEDWFKSVEFSIVYELTPYISSMQNRQMWTSLKAKVEQQSPAYVLFCVKKYNENTSLQILQEWFELDNLTVLRVPGDLDRDTADLKDAIEGADVVWIDDIDKLLETLPAEQKEILFDLLASRRLQGDVIIFYTSSRLADNIAAYDYGRLDLYEVEPLFVDFEYSR